MASQQKTPTCYDILQEFIQDSPLNFWFSFLHTFYVHSMYCLMKIFSKKNFKNFYNKRGYCCRWKKTALEIEFISVIIMMIIKLLYAK